VTGGAASVASAVIRASRVLADIIKHRRAMNGPKKAAKEA
jgi:hypothetical protein